MSIEWIGSEYGGWMVETDMLNSSSVVFDCGVGKDFSFATELIKKVGCKVYAFDCTPSCIKYWADSGVPKGIQFYGHGIWNRDGRYPLYHHKIAQYDTRSMRPGGEWQDEIECYSEFKTLRSTMKDIGITHVDYLKLCLGADVEYDIIKDAYHDGWLNKNSKMVSFLNLHFSNEQKHSADRMLRNLNYSPLSTPNQSRWTYVR